MAEYISREAAMAHPFANGHYDHENASTDFILGHESYKEWLENVPAADVRPVVEGAWTRKHDDVCYWFECSICGNYPPKDRWGNEWPSWFCPECGAKMKIDRNCINTEISETFFEEMVGGAE